MITEIYDYIADQVNKERKKIENQTFGVLSDIDNKPNLSSSTLFEMSGWSGCFAFEDDA